MLELQVPVSSPPHHDELLFIVIHQAYELWFKLLLHEAEKAMGCMEDGKVDRATHFTNRMVQTFRLLIQQIHMLETMTPAEFLEFRDNLKPASGFQSTQFREIEFVLGLKDPRYLEFFRSRPDHRKRLEDRLAGPDLSSAFVVLLRRLGHAVPAGATIGPRAQEDAAAAEATTKALLPIYEDPTAHAALYGLVEKLVDLDETFSLWRQHHVQVVERIIGFKRGTGGSSGAAYLRSTTSKRCFPLLWDLRTRLGEPA